MDDSAKNTCASQVDQDLLLARGINMTVEEVAGLPTSKYAAKVQSLHLGEDDLVFLKGLRRRIKNRQASQNSRRRSVEHLRRLARELRVVRACRRDALAERRALLERREQVRDKCATLRLHLVTILQERSDKTDVPSIDVDVAPMKGPIPRKISVTETKIPQLPDQHISVIVKNDIDRNKTVKCDIDREKLRYELENEEDIYERVRQELQKEMKVKETVDLSSFAKETLIIKEETPDYEEITIEDDFETTRQDFLRQIRNVNILDGKRDSDTCSERRNLSSRNSIADWRCSTFESKSLTSESKNSTVESKNSTSDSKNSTFERRSSTPQNYENESSADELDMRNDYLRSESSDRDIFECKIGKLVTQSVNHIYNDKRKVFAKTVFITKEKLSSDIKTMVVEGQSEVLNLSVKEGRRRSHGRKQSAPRRIPYYTHCDDMVLDLKMNKEAQ